MRAAIIDVRMKARLRGVAVPDRVLPIDVHDGDALIARIKTVQLRVSVLLAHVEGGSVVLPLVVVPVAEDSSARLRVIEDEPAKIAVEGLIAEARRNEVVIVREIAQMHFHERFLQREKVLRALRMRTVREILSNWAHAVHRIIDISRLVYVGGICAARTEVTIIEA